VEPGLRRSAEHVCATVEYIAADELLSALHNSLLKANKKNQREEDYC